MVKNCEGKGIRTRRQRPRSFHQKRRASSIVETGLDRKDAIEEAQRCLGQMECESCEICSLLCPDLCITRDETTGEVRIDLDYCKGCGICAAMCPKEAIHMVLEEGI
jgi:2-oxoacid:acceptor oxidoreductase delta subunit (pyruvate/2-ketoisovalerate family)